MHTKEVSELRRRWQAEKNAVKRIYGCYVNASGEIVADLDEPLSLMPQEEAEQYFALLKKALSGKLGKNLLDLVFSTQQVADSDEHRLLMALRDSALNDEAAVSALFEKIIAAYRPEGTYLILLAHDTYDVPFRSRDGERQDDASSETYSYVLCSICPVKETKPVLGYSVPENAFHNRGIDWLVGAPALGFLFPAFNDRSADIYSALYYARDDADSHDAFVDAVFRCPPPMPAETQKETFGAVLGDALEEACSFDVVQSVQGGLVEMIEEHKANKEVEPLQISKGTVRAMLTACGVPGENVARFEEQYDAQFGADTALSPRNLVETRKFEVTTPDVTIRVNPACSDLIETRVIDGVRYILIRADDGVAVNGVPIRIEDRRLYKEED